MLGDIFPPISPKRSRFLLFAMRATLYWAAKINAEKSLWKHLIITIINAVLKKTLITAAIWLAATLAVLFGLALLLNNALVLGEALAILCVLTVAAVTMIVNTVLLILADVKKKN